MLFPTRSTDNRNVGFIEKICIHAMIIQFKARLVCIVDTLPVLSA